MLNPQQQSTFIFVSHCRLEALALSYRAVSLHCLSSWQQGRKSRILILYGYQTDNPGSLGRMDTGHRPWQPYHLPTITAQSPHRSGGKLCLTSFAAQERSTSGMQCDNCHGQSPRACKRRLFPAATVQPITETAVGRIDWQKIWNTSQLDTVWA